MEEGQARTLAAELLAEWQAEVDRIDDLRRRSTMDLPLSNAEFVITSVARISRTWCVHYNDRRYVDTGEIRYALAGNGPILVSDAGDVDVAGTALPAEHFVAEFESRDSN